VVDANVGGIIFDVFLILFCLAIILSEIYVFEGMRYFAFILTIWGKGLMFLFMGFFEFRSAGIGLAAAIFFWVLFVVYVILFCIVGSSAPPLVQSNNPPEFQISDADYYKDEGGNDPPPEKEKEPPVQ
jgi:ABC-type transport system involved in multi-copper enzyme maturation permease subunit